MRKIAIGQFHFPHVCGMRRIAAPKLYVIALLLFPTPYVGCDRNRTSAIVNSTRFHFPRKREMILQRSVRTLRCHLFHFPRKREMIHAACRRRKHTCHFHFPRKREMIHCSPLYKANAEGFHFPRKREMIRERTGMSVK